MSAHDRSRQTAAVLTPHIISRGKRTCNVDLGLVDVYIKLFKQGRRCIPHCNNLLGKAANNAYLSAQNSACGLTPRRAFQRSSQRGNLDSDELPVYQHPIITILHCCVSRLNPTSDSQAASANRHWNRWKRCSDGAFSVVRC